MNGLLLENNRSWDSLNLILAARNSDIPYEIAKGNNPELKPGYVPFGSVEWTENLLGRRVKPDYYPIFLKRYISRNIWESLEWPATPVFIKPADQYKRFTGCISDSIPKQSGPFFCSDIVSFKSEWRFYIIDGAIWQASWYAGDEYEDPPLFLDVPCPGGWCGAIDFGRLETGQIELIEAHHPFACGWYGKNYIRFIKFISSGWEYMINKQDLL